MQSYEFKIQSRKEDIDFINKIIEAYEEVGVVRTTDPQKGLITVVSTAYYKDLAREIILDLGKNYVKAEILEEGPWQGVL